ncbi:MAG TPA: DUF983 domain-containing protein [Acidimicrobiia bacterium]|jgi:uncharacterized protein (DUF983 family)|nr:DUF983 domain-containing protein [Acidimicrobiia bacterium]
MPTSRATVFARGFTRRCPRCGSGKLFRHYLSMVPDCPRCGLHFEREQGYWAGAIAINIICVGVVFVIGFTVAMILTVPDTPIPLMLAIFVPIVALGPILWYPFSKTLWVAVDRAFLHGLDQGAGIDDHNRI